MRLNKYLAQATGSSRRAADGMVTDGRVQVNGSSPTAGMQVHDSDVVTLDGKAISAPTQTTTVLLNKPVGYVCSRNGQGSPTIYELLPAEYARLKPAGRLDKDSSGLIIITDDGALAQQLTHPSNHKTKIYDVVLDKALSVQDQQRISTHAVALDDGLSGFDLAATDKSGLKWQVSMQEGRNRQIRRTFTALGYTVRQLHRIRIDNFELGKLRNGSFIAGDNNKHSKKS